MQQYVDKVKNAYNKTHLMDKLRGEGYAYGDAASKQASLDKQEVKQEANKKLNAYNADITALKKELLDSGLSDAELKEIVTDEFIELMFTPKGELSEYKNKKQEFLKGLYPKAGYYNLYDVDGQPDKEYMKDKLTATGAEGKDQISNKKIVQGYADTIHGYFDKGNEDKRKKFTKAFREHVSEGGNDVVQFYAAKKKNQTQDKPRTKLELYLEAKLGCHNVDPNYEQGYLYSSKLGDNDEAMCKEKMRVFAELEEVQKALAGIGGFGFMGFGGARKSKRKSKKSKKSKRKSKKPKRKTRRSKK